MRFKNWDIVSSLHHVASGDLIINILRCGMGCRGPHDEGHAYWQHLLLLQGQGSHTSRLPGTISHACIEHVHWWADLNSKCVGFEFAGLRKAFKAGQSLLGVHGPLRGL